MRCPQRRRSFVIPASSRDPPVLQGRLEGRQVPDQVRDDGLLSYGIALPIFPSMPAIELSTDVALGVAIPSRNARGRIARLGSTVDSILASHDYPPLVERL